MNDIFEYLKWRGDLSFDASPLNDIDALIFCQLSYIDLKQIVPEDFSSSVTYRDAVKLFKNAPDYDKRSHVGLMINPKTIKLLYEAGLSERFGNVRLTGLCDRYNTERQEQFCAVTNIINDKSAFIAFRGTDDTLTGWREDFNLAFMEQLPAQKDALDYLTESLSRIREYDIYTGGHSKGGNLAVYASALCEKVYNDRIKAVYNFDGPGFSKETLSSTAFMETCRRIHSIYPQSSMIGMLFDHYSHYKIVKSREILIMQHDPFSWCIKPVDFETKEMLDNLSISINSVFNKWIYSLTADQRQQFVDTLFKVLDTGKGETLSELSKNWFSNLGSIIKAASELDDNLKAQTFETLKLLFKVYLNN